MSNLSESTGYPLLIIGDELADKDSLLKEAALEMAEIAKKI